MQPLAVAGPSRIRPPTVHRIALARYSTPSTHVPAPPRRRGRLDLVAPPDPNSNIRPIIYASLPPSRGSNNSPYSTGEFPHAKDSTRLEDLELEWRLSRERVDMMNHRFWAATNQEFNAQLQHRLSHLPLGSDPASADDMRRREDCLTQFYADWQVANREKQTRWVLKWWREVWAGLGVQLKVHWARVFWSQSR